MTMLQIRQATGAKRSQIENWARRGWLPTAQRGSGTGNERTYTDADAAAVKIALEAIALYGPESAKHVLLRLKGGQESPTNNLMTKQMISFTDPQRKFLIREAKRLGIPIAELVRRIIDAHIEATK